MYRYAWNMEYRVAKTGEDAVDKKKHRRGGTVLQRRDGRQQEEEEEEESEESGRRGWGHGGERTSEGRADGGGRCG